jgi:hypothetical protein
MIRLRSSPLEKSRCGLLVTNLIGWPDAYWIKE